MNESFLLPTVITRFWPLWAVWILWGLLIVLAARSDGALILPGLGRGLLEHYGFAASFIAGPILLITSFYIRRYFPQAAQDLIEKDATDKGKEEIRTEIRPEADSGISARNSIRLLLMLSLAGAVFSIQPFIELSNPKAYWGNDVFNASRYVLSYWAANSYLLVLWILIYPLTILQIISTSVAAQFLVTESIRRKVLHLDLLHPDLHAGMTRFGYLNLLLMTVWLLPAATLASLYYTHDKSYFSPVAVALFFAALFTFHSIVGLWRIASSIRTERDAAVVVWNGKIGRLMDRKGSGATETLIAMKYRDCLLAVRLLPYAKPATAGVNVLRLTPAAIAIIQVVK